ncbi:3-deoxy-D-manno-octulosonic acid transferase [Desulfogranum japonicum]|uniref:3-deoxy-D-manno-octulosonic acid transferase n=1 Tax=Desulfogranum japonicum TaxID=231447 RepID=UPI0004287342|nr:glycosyltransferase N-terminal domain-containing protein [Desulfogranum japonicum]
MIPVFGRESLYLLKVKKRAIISVLSGNVIDSLCVSWFNREFLSKSQNTDATVEKMIYWAYGFIGTTGYCILRLLLPLLLPLGGRYFSALDQRLGIYTEDLGKSGQTSVRIWLHASSVGEVQAAATLVDALSQAYSGIEYILTTTTVQGCAHAQKKMPHGVTCLLAPLDVPVIVRKALHALVPDIYICLETELWPAMLKEAQKKGVVTGILNGRISERSFRSYLKCRKVFASILGGVQRIATISADDADRYLKLGVNENRLSVCGNIKNASSETNEPTTVRENHRRYLQIQTERVLICGSTHGNEEEQLLQVFNQLHLQHDLVLILAPRHLQRLDDVEKTIARYNFACQKYSELTNEQRTSSVILLDTMGDLAKIYSAGDFIFCGGSLVPCGGHNIMEAIRWQLPVYYGSSMEDFMEAASLAENAGCGFRVVDKDALLRILKEHMADPRMYRQICKQAQKLMNHRNEVVKKQVDVVGLLLQEVAAMYKQHSSISQQVKG